MSDKNNMNSFKDTAKSVGAAFLGVQSEANRKRDFTQGKFSHFIIAGVIGVVLFIGVLLLVVSAVLP
jgi:hypothetical protein